MKKKTLPLLMLIAGLSTAALAACGHDHKWEWKNSTDGTTHWQECACGEKLEGSEGTHDDADSNGTCDACGAHVHNYVWKSDAVKHWQECSYDAGHKISESAHGDVKNNETGIEFPDGKCDDCENTATVRFAMKGHGTAPASQYVALGGKATAPETPADDDAFEFKGWYKDSACETEFDFETETIDEITTIFAKWEENKNEGESKAHAYELSMVEDDNLKPVKNGKEVIFKFTADMDGRYTIGLGSAENSQNCTFTTTLTGDTVYGKGQAASEFSFDIDRDDSVYVTLVFHGTDGDGVAAGLVLTEALGEALPEGYFLSGEYTDDAFASLILDRDKQEITYNGETYPIKYIGGRFDRVHFDLSIGRLYIIHNDDDTYTFAQYSEWFGGYQERGTLNYFVAPETLIELDDIVGYYELQENTSSNISELYIFASTASEDDDYDPNSDKITTNVLYKLQGQYNSATATYYKNKNRLSFNIYNVALNLNGSSVESLQIGSGTFTRTRSELGTFADELPLDSDSSEYYGTKGYAIRAVGTSYLFGETGNNGISIIEKVDNKYTVAVKVGNDFETYKLTVSQDQKTITLYGENGTTEVDTLTLLEYAYTNLSEGSITIQTSAFQKGSVGTVRLYKVENGGWHKFTNIPEGVEIYYCGVTEFNSYAKANGKLVADEPLNLEDNSLVCVFVEEAKDVAFNLAASNPADGWEGGDAKALVDGTATITDIKSGTDDDGNPLYTYSFKYTASAAGNYQLHVFYNGGLDFYESIAFTVDGEAKSVYYYGQYGGTQRFVVITATEGQEFNISIPAQFYGAKNSLTVSVVDDYTTGAEDVALTGEPDGDSLTLSATVTTGSNYVFEFNKEDSEEEPNEKDITATANAAFTVKTQNGIVLNAELSGGKYVATIPADTDYFTLISDAEQDVILSQTYEKGSKAYPLTVALTNDKATLTIAQTKTVYFTLPAGAYMFSATESVSLYKGEDRLAREDEVFTVKADDVLYCPYYFGSELSVTLSLEKLTTIFTEEQVGGFTGFTMLDDIPVALKISDLFGTVVYTVGKQSYKVMVTKDGTAYSFVYGANDEIRVKFTFDKDGNLVVLDDSLDAGGAFTLEAVAGPTTYESEEDWFGIATLIINADMESGTYTVGSDGPFEVTITKIGDTYTFDYGEGWMASTVTFTDNGDGTLTLEDFFGEITLTKQS